MENFRLIAIRPLAGCNPKFLKVLKPGELYILNGEYEVNGKGSDGLDLLCRKPEGTGNVPSDFYRVDNIQINISAIVGKNGSGKSSLVDLLIVAIYLLSIEEKILENHPVSIQTKLDKKWKERQSILSNRDAESNYKVITRAYSNKHFYLRYPYPIFPKQIIESFLRWQEMNEEIAAISKEIRRLEGLAEQIKDLQDTIKVEIFYEVGGDCFKLKICTDGDAFCKIYQLSKDLSIESTTFNQDKFNISTHFFYSVLLNYSSYALNSKEFGSWIAELFQKNDAYQTPIVMNPMRKKGIIDINAENYLVRSRLLAILLSPVVKAEDGRKENIKNNPRNLISNKIARRLKIKPDLKKIELLDSLDQSVWSRIEEFLSITLEAKEKRRETSWDNHARRYIVSKLRSMAEKYGPYNDYYQDGNFQNLKAYIAEVNDDPSHIAFKVKQAINFLKYDYAFTYSQAEQGLSLEVLSNALGEFENWSLVTLVPPSFLEVDVLFSDSGSDKNTLSQLSSGEKQKVYSTSSMIYHLQYLDSVRRNPEKGIKYKYKYINFVFDEIELYYHPELQRNFIQDFRTAVARANLKSIKAINCIFVTHSPFILSDIPHQNVLMLEIDNEGKFAVPRLDSAKTLGANIHEMLMQSFFMDSTVGAFALEKIAEIVDFHYKVLRSSPKDLKDLTDEFSNREKEFEFVEKNIGEKIVSRILKNHLDFIKEKLNVGN